jgi:hypothetical protein
LEEEEEELPEEVEGGTLAELKKRSGARESAG